MTTFTDIEARLTGPGGPFETHSETIDTGLGDVEMTTYVSRFGDLRQVAQFAALAHGDKEFIVYGDRRITFSEFFAQTDTMSAALTAAGVLKGDRVAVLSQNNPEWCLTFWATVNIGAVLVGLNGWWTTDEILYGLEDSGAKVLVADSKRFTRIITEINNIDTLERVYLVDVEPSDTETTSAKVHAFSELLDLPEGEAAAEPTTELTEADPAVIFYTSGTTGRPKGAVSTHRSMIANLQNTVFLVTANSMVLAERAAAAGASPPDGPSAQPVALFTSPLFHVSGCHSTLVVGSMGGMKLVMIEGKFSPERALSLIADEAVTTWATVPTMIWRTCEFPGRHDYDTSTVTAVSFGGSPSADELQRRIRETFPNVKATTNAYGLTETSSVATVLTGDDALTKADSVGRPVPTVRIAVTDGAGGITTTPGVTGEVLISGPVLMAGYWNKPEATATAIRDGWLYTGDVGHIDDEGYLFITDRAKDMIIRGGENIYCVEIENCLVTNDAVADAAIVGVPHEGLGEEVKAFIELAPGATMDAAAVQAWVSKHLAPFKVPTYVEFWDGKLPRNASGKLLKNVLRGEGDVSFQETM